MKSLILAAFLVVSAWACADVVSEVRINITRETPIAWIEFDDRRIEDGEVFVFSDACDFLEIKIVRRLFSGVAARINGEALEAGEIYIARNEYGEMYEHQKIIVRSTGLNREIDVEFLWFGCAAVITYMSLNIFNNGDDGAHVKYEDGYRKGTLFGGVNDFSFPDGCSFMLLEIIRPSADTKVFINGELHEGEFFIAHAGMSGKIYNISFGAPHTSISRNPTTSRKTANTARFAGIRNGQITLNLNAGNYTVELFNLQGRLIGSANINAINGLNSVGIISDNLAKGVFILNVRQAQNSVLRQRVAVW